jgi:carbonic anhydrase
MEMQIIHEAPPGAIEPSDHDTPHHAIVSVLFKKEETQAIPQLIMDITHDGYDVDFMKSLFGSHHNFYYYKGSHAQPPSVDFVHWFVLKNVLPVTAKKINFLHNHWHDSHGFTNFRVTQPLYGRKVLRNFE